LSWLYVCHALEITPYAVHSDQDDERLFIGEMNGAPILYLHTTKDPSRTFEIYIHSARVYVKDVCTYRSCCEFSYNSIT
jgi:hypothetical protein